MVKRVRPVLYVVAAVIAVAGIVLGAQWLAHQSDDQIVEGPDVSGKAETDSSDVVRVPPLSEALGVREEDFVEVGGVRRPKQDFIETKVDLEKERRRFLSLIKDAGNAPSIKNDENEHVKQLAADLEKHQPQNPAASPFFAAERFDRNRYIKDPEAYLVKTRPARVFQAAKPSENVTPVESDSPRFSQVLQGESVILRVKAEPEMPVTFHTQQLGEFQNRLKTISVAANSDGVAEAQYKATAGTQGLTYIMAASPVHSGKLTFVVDVLVQ